MSNEIATFDAPDDRNSSPLHLTAFVGGENLGRAVQLTIGREWACLSDAQTRELIAILQARLDGEISVTGTVDELTVDIDGTTEKKDA